jgi:hypothetical protein
MLIGCFEVELLSRGRWRVRNTLTTYEHVTYGTEEEIREVLEQQSVAWKKRFAGGEGGLTKGRFQRGPVVKPKAG